MSEKIKYECSRCGARGYRLWRQYQTLLDHIELLCADCAEKDQDRKLNPEHPSRLRWLVAAIPTEEFDTFWGYTSVPNDRIVWWYEMPLRPGVTVNERLAELRRLWKETSSKAQYWYKQREEESDRRCDLEYAIMDVLAMEQNDPVSFGLAKTTLRKALGPSLSRYWPPGPSRPGAKWENLCKLVGIVFWKLTRTRT